VADISSHHTCDDVMHLGPKKMKILEFASRPLIDKENLRQQPQASLFERPIGGIGT